MNIVAMGYEAISKNTVISLNIGSNKLIVKNLSNCRYKIFVVAKKRIASINCNLW